MAVPPKPNRVRPERESRDGAVEKSGHDEPFGASRMRRSCRQESGWPEPRGASHDGQSAKDQLRCAVNESSSNNPDGLKD